MFKISSRSESTPCRHAGLRAEKVVTCLLARREVWAPPLERTRARDLGQLVDSSRVHDSCPEYPIDPFHDSIHGLKHRRPIQPGKEEEARVSRRQPPAPMPGARSGPWCSQDVCVALDLPKLLEDAADALDELASAPGVRAAILTKGKGGRGQAIEGGTVTGRPKASGLGPEGPGAPPPSRLCGWRPRPTSIEWTA